MSISGVMRRMASEAPMRSPTLGPLPLSPQCGHIASALLGRSSQAHNVTLHAKAQQHATSESWAPVSRTTTSRRRGRCRSQLEASAVAEPPQLEEVASIPDVTQTDISSELAALNAYWNDGSPVSALLPAAVQAASSLQHIMANAVNQKAVGLRSLQASVIPCIPAIASLATLGHPVAYELLQKLCFRNNVTCKQIANSGIVERIAARLTATEDLELQCAMCHLLTGMVAFCEAAHEPIITAGLVPQLVALCRLRTGTVAGMVTQQATLQTRAAAVLRNLAHNTKSHGLLINAGAVDVMVDILKHEQDHASRVNAAMAVACLVGHEEGNPKLQLKEDLVIEMLQVLDAACHGRMRHGTFWTVWKLCQGLASLTVNDRNKELITSHKGVEILAQVLFGKHHNNEAAHRFALSALWNLAFNETSRTAIVDTPGLVDAIRSTLATTENARTKEVAKGALWTLGLEQDVRFLHEGRVASGPGGILDEGDAAHGGLQGDAQGVEGGAQVPHVMLSYEWGCQQSVMLMKQELQKAGYATWMDIDKMSGSTLEAMARAVEDSAVVIVCVSKRYKESQACRTEAEYAFQQRKKIIPILMERDYKPSGWLGALMGTRLYFSLHDARQIASKMPSLIKELGEAGRIPSAGSSTGGNGRSPAPFSLSMERPENWTNAEVEDWLRRLRCVEHIPAFKKTDMDGVALCGLYRMSVDYRYVHETLESQLGITLLGQRLRMIEELHRLFS